MTPQERTDLHECLVRQRGALRSEWSKQLRRDDLDDLVQHAQLHVLLKAERRGWGAQPLHTWCWIELHRGAQRYLRDVHAMIRVPNYAHRRGARVYVTLLGDVDDASQ